MRFWSYVGEIFLCFCPIYYFLLCVIAFLPQTANLQHSDRDTILWFLRCFFSPPSDVVHLCLACMVEDKVYFVFDWLIDNFLGPLHAQKLTSWKEKR